MQLKNSTTRFGFIAIAMHWLVALTVFPLFALGWWMTELDYYDSWYKLGPWWHKSIGILLFSGVNISSVLAHFYTTATAAIKPPAMGNQSCAYGSSAALFIAIGDHAKRLSHLDGG